MKKILVIDDSSTDREIFKLFLGNEGYDVVAVSGGQEGLIRMAQEHFDLVLCDYNMPEMDGEAFIQRIRQDAVLKSSIVIIVTSDESKEIRVRLLRNGANDFINKGAAREEIIARIEAHLNTRSNVHEYIGGVWTDALVKIFSLLNQLKTDIQEKDPLEVKNALNPKIEQMEQVLSQVVSKAKK